MKFSFFLMLAGATAAINVKEWSLVQASSDDDGTDDDNLVALQASSDDDGTDEDGLVELEVEAPGDKGTFDKQKICWKKAVKSCKKGKAGRACRRKCYGSTSCKDAKNPKNCRNWRV